MSHHGNRPLEELGLGKLAESIEPTTQEELLKALQSMADIEPEYQKEFPDDRLNKDDEGIIAFRITNAHGRIVIDFGKSVHWVGFTAKEAKGLAELILKHVKEVE